jgi:hypothetical protein
LLLGVIVFVLSLPITGSVAFGVSYFIDINIVRKNGHF